MDGFAVAGGRRTSEEHTRSPVYSELQNTIRIGESQSARFFFLLKFSSAKMWISSSSSAEEMRGASTKYDSLEKERSHIQLVHLASEQREEYFSI